MTLTPYPIKEHVISLLGSGRSSRNVAAQTRVSQSTLARLHKQHLGPSATTNTGRPRTLSKRQERFIVRSAVSGSTVTAVEAQASLQASSLANVSTQTVRRALERNSLHARIRPKKPLLRPRHRAQRIAFARKYQNWTVEDWRQVVWSDETKVCLLGPSGRPYCWRRQGGPLLEHHVLPTLEWYGLEKGKTVFRHDNDPKHKAKATMQWLSDSGPSVLDWPSQPPDLNPIEHLWAEFKKRLHKRQNAPDTVEDLWLAMEEEWNNLGPEVCVKLIDTMPERIAAVLQAKGGHTSW